MPRVQSSAVPAVTEGTVHVVAVGGQEEASLGSNTSGLGNAEEAGARGPAGGRGWPGEEAPCAHSGWQAWLEKTGQLVEAVG